MKVSISLIVVSVLLFGVNSVSQAEGNSSIRSETQQPLMTPINLRSVLMPASGIYYSGSPSHPDTNALVVTPAGFGVDFRMFSDRDNRSNYSTYHFGDSQLRNTIWESPPRLINIDSEFEFDRFGNLTGWRDNRESTPVSVSFKYEDLLLHPDANFLSGRRRIPESVKNKPKWTEPPTLYHVFHQNEGILTGMASENGKQVPMALKVEQSTHGYVDVETYLNGEKTAWARISPGNQQWRALEKPTDRHYLPNRLNTTANTRDTQITVDQRGFISTVRQGNVSCSRLHQFLANYPR